MIEYYGCTKTMHAYFNITDDVNNHPYKHFSLFSITYDWTCSREINHSLQSVYEKNYRQVHQWLFLHCIHRYLYFTLVLRIEHREQQKRATLELFTLNHRIRQILIFIRDKAQHLYKYHFKGLAANNTYHFYSFPVATYLILFFSSKEDFQNRIF